MADQKHFYALLTGANSGLGLSLAHRLLDEFLSTHPHSHSLTLIITTRSAAKGIATITTLTKHLNSLSPSSSGRVALAHYPVDLTNLSSVSKLSKDLIKSYAQLDFIVLNAGMGSFVGVDWLRCFGALLKNWIQAVTYPQYKIQDVGWTTAQEAPPGSEIATVFAANVFGHYYLAHELMELLSCGQGRIIWTSSLEAYSQSLNVNDIQGLWATHSYESSKRLTDILSLTSALPSTSPFTDTFFTPPSPVLERVGRGPKMYVSHPGICGTGIMPLNFLLFHCMVFAFYIARWFGSPWHTIGTYSGAKAAAWLAIAPEDELESMAAEKIKWGSACTRTGKEVVQATQVEGEGGDGWEDLGRDCWRMMEDLRKSWRERLENAGE